MQGGRGGPGGRSPFSDFNDPFAGFGGFGGFGGQRSLISNLFGGRDPFDDPFFTRPFGGMLESSFFGPGGGNFPDMQPTGFIEHQAPEPKRPRGPIIEEIDSDHENEDADNEKKENPRKRSGPSNEPYVEDPDDEVEEKSSKHLQHRDNYNRYNAMQSQPQAQSFTFQSSSVSYGGANGAYYTSSKTRRMGSDGLAFEESKEADTTSGKATHRVSKGLRNKGHSITRKLKTDGKVDTMQTLHNLNEDEISGFEEAWKGTAKKRLPGWTDKFGGYENLGASSSGREEASQGGWALPSNESSQNPGNMMSDAKEKAGSSRSNQSGRMRADVRDKNGYSRGKARD
ncbi:hypothetical protein L3X38_028037 [Prunus dulcis]|uniref:Glycine-rich protein n=1 Tax=Prunus dulcis TaxID=3755 RepID=A0AAD4VP13_PRUDU|nr:hypothetical protein L3X38_028037 [Prunus dulcis]